MGRKDRFDRKSDKRSNRLIIKNDRLKNTLADKELNLEKIMSRHNAAVYLLSSRTTLLEKCLTLFYENFNQRYDYPIHVHYFDDIYEADSIEKIRKNISQNIFFHKVDYEIPAEIPEEELFFNREDNGYARRRFKPSRVGYLHMCRFVSQLTAYGQTGCLSPEMAQYQFLMRIDDDSWFKEPITWDLFDSLERYPFATGFTWNHINKNVIDTRERLLEFFKNYLLKFDYVPLNQDLRRAVDLNDEMLMHSLPWSAGNLNLYNIRKFRESNWNQYQSELTAASGDYRHRWTDIETIGLFAHTHFETGVYDLRLQDKGLYSPRLPETVGNYAPSVGTENKTFFSRFGRKLNSCWMKSRKLISSLLFKADL